MGKDRVFWSAEEERLAVDNFISMYGYDVTQKLEKRCMSAQKVLPPKRRRPWSDALRKSMRAAIVARAAAGAPPVQAPVPQEASEELSAETTPTPSDYVHPKEVTGKRQKIYWDDAERAAVVSAALQLGAPDRGDSESRLRLAMEVLPVERRRPPTDPTLKSWLNKEVRKALAAAPPAPPVAAAPAPAPTPQPAPAAAPEPVVASPAANGAASYEGLTIGEEDVGAPRTVGEQFAEGCGVAIGHMLTTALTYGPLKDALRALIATVMGQSTGTVTTPEKAASFNTTPNPTRKPRVLISGLKDPLVDRLQKAFPQLVLRNWNTDKSMDQLRRTATECDVAIGILSNMSHSADAVMRDRAANYVRLPGGITSLKGQLEQIAKKGVAQVH